MEEHKRSHERKRALAFAGDQTAFEGGETKRTELLVEGASRWRRAEGRCSGGGRGGWGCVGGAEIYVCVAGDRGLQRETAGPIIDGALPRQRHPQSLAGPSAWSLLALRKWLRLASLFSTRALFNSFAEGNERREGTLSG